MLRRTLGTVFVVTAACAGGLLVAPVARAVSLANCTAFYEGGAGGQSHWSIQADWFATDGTTTPLGHVPGTPGHTGDVACWTGTNAPTVDGTYTVAGFVGTGANTGGSSYSLSIDDGSLTTTADSQLTDDVNVYEGTLALAGGVKLTALGTEDQFGTSGILNLGAGSTVVGPSESEAFIAIFPGGTLDETSDATLTNLNLDVQRGTINLGSASAPATLSVSGAFSSEGTSVVDAYLDGTPSATGSFSQLTASSLTLDGGSLVTTPGPGFTGNKYDSYKLLAATTGETGEFSDASSALAAGFTAYPKYDAEDVTEQIFPTYAATPGNYQGPVPTGTRGGAVGFRSLDGTVESYIAGGHDPDVSPDGGLLSYLTGSAADNSDATLYVKNMVTGNTTQMTAATGGGAISGSAISPDDGIIAFSQGCSIYTESTFSGTPVQLLAGDAENCFTQPQLSSDGTELVATSSENGVGTTDPDLGASETLRAVPNTQAGDALGAISPDLSTIAFVRPEAGGATVGSAVDVYVGPAAFSGDGGISRDVSPEVDGGTSLTRLNSTPFVLGGESPVRWSTDGSGVFVDGNVDQATVGGRDGIYRFEASAQGPAELVTGTLTPASSQTGTDEAFSGFLGATAATTLPLTLTPGSAGTPFTLVVDDTQHESVEQPEVTFTFSGIVGLTPADVIVNDPDSGPLTAEAGPSGTVVVADSVSGEDADSAVQYPFTLDLAAGTPSGTLHVTSQVADEPVYATADAPIIVGSSLSAPAATATAGDTTATVTFSASTGGATSYQVNLIPAQGDTAQSATVPATGAASYSHQFTGLVNGDSYTAQVVASDGSGDTATSNSVTVVPSGLPGPPSSLTATVSGQGQVTVAVGAANPDGSPVTDYHLTLGGPGSPAKDLAAPGTVTFSGLPDSATYTASAFAVNANGNGQSISAVGVTTPATPAPNAPGDVAAAPGDMQATVSFTPPATSEPITSYLVTLTPVTGGAAISVPTTGSPVVVPGLTNGITYAVTVLAIGPSGHSPVSGQGVTVTPHARPTPPHITGIAPAPETLLVGFNQANGDGLAILADTVTCVGTNHQTAVARGTSSPIMVNHLHNQVNYTCSVVATTAAGTSLVSNKVVAHPGKLPNVKLTLPASVAKGTRITITATLTAAGDLVPNRLTTLYVSADSKHRHYVAIAKGRTDKHGVVVFHTVVRKNSIYQVQAYFGPALARNFGDRVRAI